MSSNAPTEFPEQRFTKDLKRICEKLQSGDQADHSLAELFEVLIQYCRELDGDRRTLDDQILRFMEPEDGSLNNNRLSILMAMLQDTQTQLRGRVLKVAERIDAYDVTRQAHTSYGDVAHGEHASRVPHGFRHQS